MFALVPFVPHVPWEQCALAQSDSLPAVGLYQSQRNTILGNTKYFLKGLQSSLPKLWSRGIIIFIILDSKQICCLLWRETLFLLPMFACYTSWKDSLKQKCPMSVYSRCAECRNQLRIVSQQSLPLSVISFVWEFKSFHKFKIRLIVCILGDK